MFDLSAINFNFTTIIFYWAYLLVLALYFLMACVNIYHLLKFGPRSSVNYAIIFLFLIISAIIISSALLTLAGFDWQVAIWDSNWLLELGGSNRFPVIK